MARNIIKIYGSPNARMQLPNVVGFSSDLLILFGTNIITMTNVMSNTTAKIGKRMRKPMSMVSPPSGVYENQLYFISEVPMSTRISDVESVPMAFSDCAKESILENLPSSATSRINGLPETCRMVAPAPISSTANRIIGKLKAKIGSNAPTRKSTNPMVSIFFLPILDCHTPVGTDKTPNMIIPDRETNDAVNGVTLKAFSTTETNCPAASPKPMAKNTKNTEIRDNCFFIFLTYF